MKLNPKILKQNRDGIWVFIASPNQKHYQTALILHYEEKGLWFRTLFGLLPGQTVTIGMSARNGRNGSREIETLVRTQIIWCKMVQTDKGAYFVSRAEYDLHYLEGHQVVMC